MTIQYFQASISTDIDGLLDYADAHNPAVPGSGPVQILTPHVLHAHASFDASTSTWTPQAGPVLMIARGIWYISNQPNDPSPAEGAYAKFMVKRIAPDGSFIYLPGTRAGDSPDEPDVGRSTPATSMAAPGMLGIISDVADGVSSYQLWVEFFSGHGVQHGLQANGYRTGFEGFAYGAA